MRFFFLIVCIATAAPAVHGCLWDRDTLKDEMSVAEGAKAFDLITGQFPHHGKAYYEHRIRKLAPIADSSASRDEINDLAVAYIRVGSFDPAYELLQRNLKESPRDYFTLSNLGVLEKKRGNFAEAADWVEQALAIKPEGHMGLGDWYLKMLRYRAKLAADPKSIPTINFLGKELAKAFRPRLESERVSPEMRASALRENKTYQKLSNLLRNDQTFADGFLAMGDFLSQFGDLHLAFLAYSRAIELDHRNSNEIRRRRRALLNHRENHQDKRFRGNSRRLAWWDAEVKKANRTIAKSAAWLRKFQAAEARLVASKGDAVEFAIVEAALVKAGTTKSRP